MTNEEGVVAPLQAAEAAIVERMQVFAIRCGVQLNEEEDPVTFSDVRRAAVDESDLLAGIWWAHQVLPQGLADYLARSWQVHVDCFERVRRLPELEIATSWARRHAVAARALLALPKPSPDAAQPPTSEASPR